jgi:hypothetical protein
MKKFASVSRILLAGTLALLLVSSVAFAAVQDFTIVNNTGADLYGLYISSAASESWEENMIEGQVFPAGNSLTVSFEGYDRNQCIWDIMVTDEDEEGLTWEGLNLCEVSQVVLNWDGEEGWVDLQ